MRRTDLLQELRNSSLDEMTRRVVRLERELALYRIRNSMKRLENAMQIRTCRKEIALAKTLLAQQGVNL